MISRVTRRACGPTSLYATEILLSADKVCAVFEAGAPITRVTSDNRTMMFSETARHFLARSLNSMQLSEPELIA